jgi:hypothetical protein
MFSETTTGTGVTLKKAAAFACENLDERWMRVAFLNGKLAATAGTAQSLNPHPADSPPARSWLAGWRARARTVKAPPAPATALRRSRHEGEMTMDMIEKLPAMADADLGILVGNAERLAQSGTPKQQKAAQDMLPSLQAEVAARADRKAAATPPKRAPRVASRKTAAPPLLSD